MRNGKIAILGVLGSLLAADGARAGVLGGCDMIGTADLSESCALQSRWDREMTIALHYGSLASDALVVEIVRAEAAPEQLERLAEAIRVDLQVTTPDFSGRFRRLEARVEGDQLVLPMDDRNESSFYISQVRVSSRDALARVVKEIFGPRAVALISARARARD
jgi:hypothetical protein